MSRFALIVRFLLFCLFFTIGAGAITLSILIKPELSNYYHNQDLLDKIRQENIKIRDLTGQYQARIDLIRKDPKVLQRLGKLTFGDPPAAEEDNTLDPKAEGEDLRQAAAAILEETKDRPDRAELPAWFQRCSRPNFRTALFTAGGALVLIAFIFFGIPGKKAALHKNSNFSP